LGSGEKQELVGGRGRRQTEMREHRPSRTARKVALNIVSLGAKPGMERVLPAGIVDATADLLVAAGVVGETAVRWARSRAAVSVYEAFDWMMPGQFEAFGHRKRFCEDQVRRGIGSGATQVLVLGAGYDTLGWRLAPELAEVGFFEIDHPATARLKAKGIAAMGPRANLYLIQEDLGRRKLVDVLGAHPSWDPGARTVIVAEGLLMYLPPEAVQDLFQQFAAITAPGSRLAFTHAATGADGRPDAGPWTGTALRLLAAAGEPWLWSIRPEDLGAFLQAVGWTHAPDLLGRHSRNGVEYLGVATR
jgi:methyltransferase (TIGR00027 family)